MGRKKKKIVKPWCWYCNREFQDEKILTQHQKARHFKCHICHRKLFSGPGLVTHCLQVHKETIARIPFALPGRDSIQIDIFGMRGVPADEEGPSSNRNDMPSEEINDVPSPVQQPYQFQPMFFNTPQTTSVPPPTQYVPPPVSMYNQGVPPPPISMNSASGIKIPVGLPAPMPVFPMSIPGLPMPPAPIIPPPGGITNTNVQGSSILQSNQTNKDTMRKVCQVKTSSNSDLCLEEKFLLSGNVIIAFPDADKDYI
uniref:BED-type domain-containing protein n=1 Tax=Parastrongyloides trichosuri TaxID=131310 RepID=A0A0N4ZL88_PARTI